MSLRINYTINPESLEPNSENATKLHTALVKFGFESVLPPSKELAEPNKVFMLVELF